MLAKKKHRQMSTWQNDLLLTLQSYYLWILSGKSGQLLPLKGRIYSNFNSISMDKLINSVSDFIGRNSLWTSTLGHVRSDHETFLKHFRFSTVHVVSRFDANFKTMLIFNTITLFEYYGKLKYIIISLLDIVLVIHRSNIIKYNTSLNSINYTVLF